MVLKLLPFWPLRPASARDPRGDAVQDAPRAPDSWKRRPEREGRPDREERLPAPVKNRPFRGVPRQQPTVLTLLANGLRRFGRGKQSSQRRKNTGTRSLFLVPQAESLCGPAAVAGAVVLHGRDHFSSARDSWCIVMCWDLRPVVV